MGARALFAIVGGMLGSALLPVPSAAQQPETETAITTRGIAGVVATGSRVERVWTGLQAADGLISDRDGTLLLPEQRADRISRFHADRTITPYLDDTNEAGGIAFDTMGRLISVERRIPRVRVLAPERKVLADSYQGQPLQRLSDIVADQKGGVYFTEGANSAIYYLDATGTLGRVASGIDGANGIMLSPDERTLYVTSSVVGILAFDTTSDGRIESPRPFVKPEGGQDGMAVDSAGRLYVAGRSGIQVFSPQGQFLGLIPVPRPTTTLAFAGPDKKTLYVIGRGHDGPGGDGGDARSLYRISMLAEGFKGRAK